MPKRNYWCYRINKDKPEYFWKELMQNRLRQGWGWLKGQDLRNLKIDRGARRNLPIFNKVKKGDILLIPRLKEWDEIAIAEAIEDFDEGYKYDFTKEHDGYGHIFPAKYIKRFKRHNENVSGNIRSTFQNLSRFWGINHCSKDVDKLLKIDESKLTTTQDLEIRFDSSIEYIFKETFDEINFSNELFKKMNEQFKKAEWEYALVHGFQQLFPSYNIEHTGGANENKHGTDILIRIPGIIPDFEYGIAIQVKDYEGFVADDVIKQINKSEKYWNDENFRIIEKIVIITKAGKEENIELVDNKSRVKFIFAEDLKTLLSNIGKIYIGVKI